MRGRRKAPKNLVENREEKDFLFVCWFFQF